MIIKYVNKNRFLCSDMNVKNEKTMQVLIWSVMVTRKVQQDINHLMSEGVKMAFESGIESYVRWNATSQLVFNSMYTGYSRYICIKLIFRNPCFANLWNWVILYMYSLNFMFKFWSIFKNSGTKIAFLMSLYCRFFIFP